jgi:hypothetical protein
MSRNESGCLRAFILFSVGLAAQMAGTGCVFDASGLGTSRRRESSVVLPDGTPGDGIPHPDGSPADQARSEDTAFVPERDPRCPEPTCPLGCDAAAQRCYRLQPSNGVDVTGFFEVVSGRVTQAGDFVFHTDTGEVEQGGETIRDAGSPGAVDDKGVYWGLVKQASGYPELSVFGFRSFKAPGGTISVKGGRALVIYAVEDVEIGAALVVGATGESGGAGGFRGGSKDGNDGASCWGGQGKGGDKASGGGGHESGGGGGGRMTTGGAGGNVTSTPSLAGGQGGTAAGTDTLAPLFGGCGGGGGGGSEGGPGGGGGGAIQISANGSITITGGGFISVPGAGGLGSNKAAGGGGGGSGGAILLEASSINVLGILAANGGGGGGGGGDHSAKSGLDGQPSADAAAGAQAGTGGTAGGTGGAGVNGGVGAAGGVGSDNTGGGGGAAGRIRLNAPPGRVVLGGIVSPAPSAGEPLGGW